MSWCPPPPERSFPQVAICVERKGSREGLLRAPPQTTVLMVQQALACLSESRNVCVGCVQNVCVCVNVNEGWFCVGCEGNVNQRTVCVCVGPCVCVCKRVCVRQFNAQPRRKALRSAR